MKKYELEYTSDFEKDKEKLCKSGDRAGQWSRRVSDKHRIIYMIDNVEVVVLLLSAYGHYYDK